SYTPKEIFFSSAELYNPATSSFTATGDMLTPRMYHTMTLLPNGKVLVTGGETTGRAALSSAELYDPATGLFTATGDMLNPRRWHTAVLLPNGKVLIISGHNDRGWVSATELYDPTTGLFTTVGNITTPNNSPIATLLSNGKVLITGGYGDSPTANVYPPKLERFSSAELYDLSAGSSVATGNMTTPKERHTATLLPTGKVLIAGGFNGKDHLATAELYDPKTGLFTAIQDMTTARVGHTATLLPNSEVLIAGGTNGVTYLSNTEIYAPSSFLVSKVSDISPGKENQTTITVDRSTTTLSLYERTKLFFDKAMNYIRAPNKAQSASASGKEKVRPGSQKQQDPCAKNLEIALSNTLKNPDIRAREGAIVAISNVIQNYPEWGCGERAINPLIDALDDEFPYVRAVARTTLGNAFKTGVPASQAIEPLYSRLVNSAPDRDGWYSPRADLLTALGHAKDQRILEMLFSAADSSDISLRRAAAEVLGNYNDPRIMPLFMKLRKDPDEGVSSDAKRYVFGYSPKSGEEALIGLHDYDPEVRAKSINALLTDKEFASKNLKYIMDALKDPGADIRSSVGTFLAS
ncbi:MAG: HEAT repeat domain-containing protein, partial [Candidatus Omnitrophica bacterium]|nr:HEAT repeat domain-containing protein [Candidatus Omnitrophota bacterium]